MRIFVIFVCAHVLLLTFNKKWSAYLSQSPIWFWKVYVLSHYYKAVNMTRIWLWPITRFSWNSSGVFCLSWWSTACSPWTFDVAGNPISTCVLFLLFYSSKWSRQKMSFNRFSLQYWEHDMLLLYVQITYWRECVTCEWRIWIREWGYPCGGARRRVNGRGIKSEWCCEDAGSSRLGDPECIIHHGAAGRHLLRIHLNIFVILYYRNTSENIIL